MSYLHARRKEVNNYGVDISRLAPALILGVPSDADRSELGVAFALASRRLKASADAPFTLEQLTTALADLEENIKSPRFRLWYQVPANRRVVSADFECQVNGVRYSSDSNFSDLQSVDTATVDRKTLGSLFLSASLQHLLKWQWREAADLARECLKHATKEDVRDEALNLLAASLLMRGDVEKAIDALRKAVEGRWNLALQTNLSVVAAETDPATAAEHMSFLIEGAPDVEQRLQAARLAIKLWKTAQGHETGSDDEDDFDPPPRPVLDAIYALLDSEDLSEEDFYEFGLFLARVDTEKLSGEELFTNSRHRASPSADLIQARLQGFMSWVNEFGTVAKKKHDRSRPWIFDDIQDFTRTVGQMIAGDNESSQKLGVLQGFRLFDSGLPPDNSLRVRLLALLILNFEVILESDQSPKDSLDVWLERAYENVRKERFDMESDEKEQLLGAIGAAASTLFLFRYREIRSILPKVENQSLLIAQRTAGLLGSLTANKSALRSTSQPIFSFCNDAKQTFNRLRPMLTENETQKGVDSILAVLTSISQRIQKWV